MSLTNRTECSELCSLSQPGTLEVRARAPTSTPLLPLICLLQDAGSQQVGFLLGSCGVTLALTTDACQKGLPKAQTGEVATFKGETSRVKKNLCSC